LCPLAAISRGSPALRCATRANAEPGLGAPLFAEPYCFSGYFSDYFSDYFAADSSSATRTSVRTAAPVPPFGVSP
jgi:hypothetical protein